MWLHCFKNATICCIAKTSQILDFPSIFVDNPWVPFVENEFLEVFHTCSLSHSENSMELLRFKDHDPDAQSFVTDQKRVFRITKEECFAFLAFRDRARFKFFPLKKSYSSISLTCVCGGSPSIFENVTYEALYLSLFIFIILYDKWMRN